MSGRVLVVDDLDINVKLLEAKLSNEYFEVLTAFSGRSITLNSVILPASFHLIMSTPLIAMPSN